MPDDARKGILAAPAAALGFSAAIMQRPEVLEAVEAGVHKIRLNPGNIQDREQVIDVIQAWKAKGLPIRIGVNEGSISERKEKQKRLRGRGQGCRARKDG